MLFRSRGPTGRLNSRLSPQFDDVLLDGQESDEVTQVEIPEQVLQGEEDTKVYFDNTLAPYSVLPSIPKEQIFSAVVVNIDVFATVWVIAQDNLNSLADIRRRCLKVNRVAERVEIGCLYIVEYNRKKLRGRIIKFDDEVGYYICFAIDSGE